MSYHGIGNASASASLSLNPSGTSFSSSFGAGGGGGGGGGGDYIWDLTCGTRGGVKYLRSDSSGFSFICNNGYGCRGAPGKKTQCSTPGSGTPPPAPTHLAAPCGSVGERTSNAKNGYTYTYCNDDRMYVREPGGQLTVFSQKEVGGAFNAGGALLAKPTTLNVSSLFSKPAPIRIDGTQGTGRPADVIKIGATTGGIKIDGTQGTGRPADVIKIGATTGGIKIDGTQGTGRPASGTTGQTLNTMGKGWMFAPPPPLEVMQEGDKAPRDVDCSVPGSCGPSTGMIVGIGLGVLALVGGGIYLATRKK